MTNQLATLPLPKFKQLQLQDVKQNLEQEILQGEQFIAGLKAIPEKFEDLLSIIEQLDLLENRISEQWGILSHLNAVMSDEQTREIYQALLPALTAYYTALGQNELLFQIYKNIEKDNAFLGLSVAKQQAIRLALRGFRLSGVDLDSEKKHRFAEISTRLSQLSSEFSNHVLDATQAYFKVLTEEQLKGIPQSNIDLLKQYGKQRELDQAVVTLDFPAYFAVMTYAEDRALREEVYRAYVMRASELAGNDELDNTLIMQEILQLRQEKAKLLGFKHYGEYSLASKMAPDVETVSKFLLDLAEYATAPAQEDIEQLEQLAKQEGIDQLKPWDLGYLSEKLKQREFNLSQEVLKPYFPMPKVISGLFSIVEKLYGVKVVQKQTETWHSDVQYFELEENGEVLGGFYFDLYARQAKRGGAWMSGFRSRMLRQGEIQKPVCFMVGNFNPPIGEQPALLTHDEVITLFHEFGHGLHHLLTEVDDLNVAGTHGVAWDAVELPSQFMEFWAWDHQSLGLLSEHIETGESLPQEILQSLWQARHFQTGMQTLRQLEFALFDLNIHCAVPALNALEIQNELDQIRQKISVAPNIAENRFQHSFSHIFAGGYACGYYSYKWAEVLASDAFDRFEQEGVFNVETGKSFRKSVLAVGGALDALDAFKKFRGREPDLQALLRHQGWKIAS